MAEPDSFVEMMARLRAGDDDVANAVFRRFASRLIGLARSKIDNHLRHKVDPEDVVQSVYRSFFRRHASHQFEVGSWDDLWYLLTVITLHKCSKRIDYARAARRDVRREVPVDSGAEAGSWWQAIDREPTPPEAAMLTELIEQVHRGFDADARQIIELSLQGYSVPEICGRLGRAERTVRRLRERARKRLEGMLAEDRCT